MIHADLYSAAGAKLDYPPLVGFTSAEFVATVGKPGNFSFQLPAENGVNATAGRRLYLYDDDRLVFRGVVRNRQTAIAQDETAMVTISGPSLSDQLLGLQTGRGLIFEDDSLSSAITTLVTDTDFSAGDVATATIPARRFDDRTRWDALNSLAQAFNCSLREDLVNGTVDINVFGDSSDIVLRQVAEMSEALAANPYVGAISSIRVEAQSFDLCNRIVPWGQVEGLGGLQFNMGAISPESSGVATRLYFPFYNGLNDSGLTWTVASGWEENEINGDVRLALSTEKSGTTITDHQFTKNSAATNYDIVRFGHIYGPLGQQTIQGNVSGQFLASESNADANARLQIAIRVISPNGTVRGTALDFGTFGNELNTSIRNISLPSTALTAVAAESGDYLAVELGVRFAAAATPRQANIYLGDNGSQDLPVDETTTDTTMNPWIEFSTNIALGGALPSGNAYAVQSGTGLGGETFYYLEDAESVAIHGVRERYIRFKDILPLGLTSFDFGQAAQILYGMAVDYLVKHKDEQKVYEVEVASLTYMDASGNPYFRVGDTVRLVYTGSATGTDGVTTAWLDVDEDLYILGFTVKYGADGSVNTKLQLSTFLRVLPSDGEVLAQMARDIGIEQAASTAILGWGGDPPIGRLVDEGIQLLSLDEVGAFSANRPRKITWYSHERFDADHLISEITAEYESNDGVATDAAYGKWRTRKSVSGSKLIGFVDPATGFDEAGYRMRSQPLVFGTPKGEHSFFAMEYDGGLLNTQATAGALEHDLTDDYWYWQSNRGGTLHGAGYQQGTGSELTISGGAVAASSGYHRIDTESDAASDDLDNITGGFTGMTLVLRAENSARTVNVTEAGNIELSATPFALDNAEDTISLIYTGSVWLETARSNNGA